ncbi:MAG: hypothetical protein ACI8RA_000864, partial [Chlamydiales bacterium]
MAEIDNSKTGESIARDLGEFKHADPKQVRIELPLEKVAREGISQATTATCSPLSGKSFSFFPKAKEKVSTLARNKMAFSRAGKNYILKSGWGSDDRRQKVEDALG